MGYEELAVWVNEDPWYEYCVEPPCGQLNIVNENMYQLLGNFSQLNQFCKFHKLFILNEFLVIWYLMANGSGKIDNF